MVFAPVSHLTAWIALLFVTLPPWPHDAQALVSHPALQKWIPHMRARRAHSSSVEKLSQDYRVVVVMTTIPPRMHRIEPVIDSMLRQTWPVAEVYLNIPHKYNRTGEGYTIPDWLQAKKGVRIVRCEDLGPGTHLLNGLRQETDPWTFLAVVDDDHIYSQDLVENLMRAALAHPGSAVAAQGFLSVPGLLESPELKSLEGMGLKRPRYLHDQGFAAGPVLVSYLGVVYQRGFFDDSVFDYSGASEQCRYQDDMWFSAHLAKKGIRRQVLGAALGVQELTDMHLGPESLTYWEDNKPRAVSDDCNQALLQGNFQLWAYRRRVVLVLGGLPPPPAAPWPSAGSFVSEDWKSALAVVKRLSKLPDLTYLCTQGWGSMEAGRPSRLTFGNSFMFEDVLVTGTDACAPNSAARVTELLRDVLLWEGDPNTVVVLGLLSDMQSGNADDMWAAADCAADMYDANREDAEREEQMMRHQEETWKEKKEEELLRTRFADKRSYEMTSTLFKEQSSISGVGELTGVQRKSQQYAGELSWPFCRLGSWAAVSVGAFTARMAGG